MPPKRQSTKGGGLFGPSKETIQTRRADLSNLLVAFATLSANAKTPAMIRRIATPIINAIDTRDYKNTTETYTDMNFDIMGGEQPVQVINKYITQTGQLRKPAIHL